MPEPVDSLTLAVAVDRPNIFAAPASRGGTESAAERTAGVNAFTSASTTARPDLKTAPLHRARWRDSVSWLLAAGLSVRGCVCLAAVVAAAVALLVLDEVGNGAPERRAVRTPHRDAGRGLAAQPDTPARHRSARARKSTDRARPDTHRRTSSRGRTPGGSSRCCRARLSRRGSHRAARVHRHTPIPSAPAPPAASAVPPAGPAVPRDYGTPAPVPLGAPPEFM